MLLINRFCVLAFYNRFGSVSRIHGKRNWKSIGRQITRISRWEREHHHVHLCKRECGYEAMGMCLGMCFGAAVGAILPEYIGVTLSMGMLTGLVIGMCFGKKHE